MVQNINLYIGGKEVFFSEPPEILYTFQRTDYTNPTVIKNSFTKTITIEGTPENNKVFGEIYLLGRTQSEQLFNPAKRVDFELFVNGDLVETGYAKLDKVNKNGYKITYEVTLYGGLGDFFYGLSYGFDYDNYDSEVEQSKDEELKLKDLTYYSPSADDDTEFNFNITKDAVYDAWRVLDGQILESSEDPDDNAKWQYINFAPAYNGLPEDFDADKVLINTSGYTGGYRLSVPAGATLRFENGTTKTYSEQQIVTGTTLPTGITIENKTYIQEAGYAAAELREPITEWDMRDMRSYLQRPILRVKGMFGAIQRYVREKGDYTLNLDTDFFNSGNTYYENAWITLPMLQNLNGEYAEQEVTGATVDLVFAGTQGTNYGHVSGNTEMTLVSKYNAVGFPSQVEYFKGGSITLNLRVSASAGWQSANMNHLDTTYYRYFDDSGQQTSQYLSAIGIQLIAYDGNNTVVNTSKHHMFTTRYKDQYGDTRSIQQQRMIHNILPNSNDCIYHYGKFYRPNFTPSTTTPDTYTWYNEDMATNSFTISLTDENVEYIKLELVITKYVTYTDKFAEHWSITDDDWERMLIYDASDQYVHYIPFPYVLDRYENRIIKSAITYKPSDKTMKSNQLITKKKLLSQEGTPCDYLISYCKLFNLYFDKDPIEKIVTIRTRRNFYDDNVINLEDKIDRSKEIKITPIASDNKWYDFNFTQGDKGELEQRYYNTWGVDFGKQKVKTEYNFDNSSKDLLDGNIYNNALTALEKSKYFTDKRNGNTQIPSFMFEWSDFKLFNTSEATIETCDEFYLGQPSPTAQRMYNGTAGAGYDFYPKLQLHDSENKGIDGSNILIFYNGTKATITSGGTYVYYNITDDIGQMTLLGEGTTCWLYTNTTTDRSGREIAKRLYKYGTLPCLPQFSRYVMSGNTITKTWDFGRCNELFVPNIEYGDEPTIYEQWWKNYIADLYNVNTRVVECYVKLDGKVEGDWLKHFYYFDDSIWCLTKIEDYNITSFDTTKCTFVKVADISNYHD